MERSEQSARTNAQAHCLSRLNRAHLGGQVTHSRHFLEVYIVSRKFDGAVKTENDSSWAILPPFFAPLISW